MNIGVLFSWPVPTYRGLLLNPPAPAHPPLPNEKGTPLSSQIASRLCLSARRLVRSFVAFLGSLVGGGDGGGGGRQAVY